MSGSENLHSQREIDMEYTYELLKEEDHFRLLHLKPGSGDGPLVISITAYPVDSDSAFDALSYVWGPPELTESVWVGKQRMGVTKNLHIALRHLRSSENARCLWIDALCINQQDDSEKSHQVAMMGKIFQQAQNVICWLGELSTHRLWALKHLEELAKDAKDYIDLSTDYLADMWTVVYDRTKDGVDEEQIIVDAVGSRVEAIYLSDWFTRVWIVQEVALAKSLVMVCGDYEMPWKAFELATRVLYSIIKNQMRRTRSLKDNKQDLDVHAAMELLSARGRFRLNNQTKDAMPLIIQTDEQWKVGRVAWEMRDRHCKEDIDRVYAFASLTAARPLLDRTLELSPQRVLLKRHRSNSATFVSDYNQTVEWAYTRFWKEFGGFTSLCHAGLAYRQEPANRLAKGNHLEFPNDLLQAQYLPSWVPELRSERSNGWHPLFSFDYSASTALQHMPEDDVKLGMISLKLRSHRFDKIVQTFGWNKILADMDAERFDEFARQRKLLNDILHLDHSSQTYPNGTSWTEALGIALLHDMPVQSDHPLQHTLGRLSLHTSLTNEKVREMWHLYNTLILSDTGAVWKKICSHLRSIKKTTVFAPLQDLDHDGKLAWAVHIQIRMILHNHGIFVTQRGYLGLGPPETRADDVVLVIGGPSVPFVARDVSEDVLRELRATRVEDEKCSERSSDTVSQLVGPCYLHGIMNGECLPIQFFGNRLDKEQFGRFEWEQDEKLPFTFVPKGTVTLV